MTALLKKRKIPVAMAAAFLLVFAAGMFAAFADDAAVTDENLKAALLAAYPAIDANGDGQLTAAEIGTLAGDVDLSGKGISDITGLEHATGVASFNLSYNKIRSVQPLVALAASPLHALIAVDVSHNYLVISSGSEDKLAIDAITAAGCAVSCDPQDAIPVDSVSLNTKTMQLGVGETGTLTASVAPADAADTALVWASGNAGVATVANGVVTAVSAGTATITVASSQNPAATDTCEITVKALNIESTKYPIDRAGGILKGVTKMTARDVFLSNLRNDAADLAIYDATGNPCAVSGMMATGMTVKLSVGGIQRDALTVVVSGDGNGDGMISITDYTLTRLGILGLKPLDNAAKAACDVNNDGKVSISDYTTIRLDILGLKPISTLPDLPDVPDARIRAFLDMALLQQGKPYVWSDEGPNSFDCSGYVYYCLTKAGYTVNRSTASSYSKNESWQYVPRDQLQPGDLMFYFSDSSQKEIGHVGIYLGNGYHIHASSDYGCVIICRVEGWYDKMLSHGRRVFY